MVEMMKELLVCFVIMFASAVVCEASRSERDRITHLPGLDVLPKFKMYSGYVELNPDYKKTFYWLTEAENRKDRTLVVWFNGGPGCSSLFGLFQENGPFILDAWTGKLNLNKYSWNKFTHMLYIEAPIGVGFSHSEQPLNTTNDHNVANQMLRTYEAFLSRHPKYNNYDVYFAGESYAGIYVPTMTVRFLNDALAISKNFKGIILGNPQVNKYVNEKTRATYAYYHGLISKEKMQFLVEENDCYNETAVMSYDEELQQQCHRALGDVKWTLFDTSLNVYNLGTPCWKRKESLAEDDFNALINLLDSSDNHTEDISYDNANDYLYYDAEYIEEETINHNVTNNVFEAYYGDIELEVNEEECENMDFLETYMNQPDVIEAIHAGRENATEWKLCSRHILHNHKRIYEDMTSRVKKIVKKFKKSVLLYYGDQDLVCNFLGGEEFVRNLGLKVTKPRTPLKMHVGDMESIVGFSDEYANRLKFTIIKNAGHYAPRDKRFEVFTLIRRWLESARDRPDEDEEQ